MIWRILLAVIIVVILVGCGTSSDEARRALTAAGMKDVKITGYRFFGCDEKDSFHTGFEATSPNGHRVTGTVCSGLFKGATIRYD